MWKKRSLTRSKKAAKRRKATHLLRAAVGLVSVLAIIGSGAFLSFSPFFQIEKVEVKGAVLTPSSEIESIVFHEMSGSHFNLFSKRNILLYPKAAIEEEITALYPRITNVKVRIGGPRSLTVLVSERTPVALWCKEKEELSSCYFLDKEGYIFSEAPLFTPEVYVRFYGPVGREEALRGTFLPSQFPLLREFVQHVEEIGFTPLSVSVEENGDVNMKVSRGSILFTLMKNLDDTRDNLASFWSENHSLLARFEYIDLRFGNKIFYRQ